LGCSSVCFKPLFSLTGNLEKGLPTDECIRKMFSIGANQKATGVVAFITGFSLLCGFCWAIPMC